MKKERVVIEEGIVRAKDRNERLRESASLCPFDDVAETTGESMPQGPISQRRAQRSLTRYKKPGYVGEVPGWNKSAW